MLLLVTGEGNSTGDFHLQITNQDQFATPENGSLFFPAGAGPSQAAVGDLNRDGKPDLVVSNAQSDTVSVLLGNGNGTFQAPRQFAIGAFRTPNVVGQSLLLSNFRRQVVIADFNHDGILDIAVTNYDSGDVSILLGRGDGTFEPQRRFNATSAPYDLAVGDLNGDGVPDLVAIDAHASGDSTIAELMGRGDGTFLPQQTLAAQTGGALPVSTVQVADLNGDGKADLVVSGSNSAKLTVFLGKGAGTFQPGVDYPAGRLGAGLTIADVNADGRPDIISTDIDTNAVVILLNNGDGTFAPLVNPISNLPSFPAGQFPTAVAVADFGSLVTRPDGSVTLGPPDGHPDLIVAASGVTQSFLALGPPEITIVPGLVDGQGHFAGFGPPLQLASAEQPQDVTVADVNGDGVPDVVAVDAKGVLVVFGQRPTIPPNDTPQTARNLGTVVHLLEPALTIVPGHQDAYYKLTVPTEAAHGAGDEVLDFSALFQATAGAGLAMEVRGAAGNLLGFGERFRVRARQGQTLTLHVFGVADAHGTRGSGAYTLDIDTLPQVVGVEAQALLPGQGGAHPGGPTASLVVTFQGDRLDPAAAQDPVNYRMTWLGPDGLPGTADDRVIPVAATQGVVYDPSANVEVASGKTYPTAVRQTVTLLFADPLPAGSYQVELRLAIQAAPFNADESGLLSPAARFTGHPLASLVNGQVTEGDRHTAADLVFARAALGDLAVFQAGTPFLTQFHDDLGALLDALLTALGDDPTVSGTIDRQIIDRFDPALGAPAARPVAVLVIWLDPVPVDLFSSGNSRVVYNTRDDSFVNTFARGFVSVAGNVEVLVIPFVPTGVQNFLLGVDPVPPGARGGVAYFGAEGNEVRSLTAALRGGTNLFLLSFGEPAPAVSQPQPIRQPPPVTPANVPPGAQPAPGLGVALSELAALVSVRGTRSEALSVTPITPLPGPSQSGVLLAQAATAAVGGEVPRPLSGGGGAADAPPAGNEALARQLLGLLDELGRAFPQLAGTLRAWLRALDVHLPVSDKRAAAERPARDEEAPPGQAEEDESPSPDESGPAEVSSADAPPRAGSSLAVILSLAGGWFLRRADVRSLAPGAGKKHPRARKDRSRRFDHAG